LLKNINRNLNVLQFISNSDFSVNLEKLLSLIDKTSENSIVVAPEVCLTGFAYDRFDEAAKFSSVATKRILNHLGKRIVILTMIEKIEGKFYNVAKVFYNGAVLYEQKKVHLFVIGDERKYFSAGDESDITLFEIEGIKIGVLICFELRFKYLWSRLEGADLITVPAMWGKPRAEQFAALSKALAIMNQCYVAAADSANDDMASKSAVIDPFGEVLLDDSLELIEGSFLSEQIEKMRRYVNVGLS